MIRRNSTHLNYLDLFRNCIAATKKLTQTMANKQNTLNGTIMIGELNRSVERRNFFFSPQDFDLFFLENYHLIVKRLAPGVLIMMTLFSLFLLPNVPFSFFFNWNHSFRFFWNFTVSKKSLRFLSRTAFEYNKQHIRDIHPSLIIFFFFKPVSTSNVNSIKVSSIVHPYCVCT